MLISSSGAQISFVQVCDATGDRQCIKSRVHKIKRSVQFFEQIFSYKGLVYFNTPNSFPTFVNAAIALSRCCCSCAALNCTRIRAKPFATTG